VTHLLRSVDMETHTMHDIGQMEMKMLDALLIGGLDNERDEREEKLMQRQRLLALGF